MSLATQPWFKQLSHDPSISAIYDPTNSALILATQPRSYQLIRDH